MVVVNMLILKKVADWKLKHTFLVPINAADISITTIISKDDYDSCFEVKKAIIVGRPFKRVSSSNLQVRNMLNQVIFLARNVSQ